jgi:hypothetical protein
VITNYQSIEAFFESNAERHDANAARHIADGRPDYALGSLRKAAKWRAKKSFFDVPPHLKEVYAITKRNFDRLLYESIMK